MHAALQHPGHAFLDSSLFRSAAFGCKRCLRDGHECCLPVLCVTACVDSGRLKAPSNVACRRPHARNGSLEHNTRTLLHSSGVQRLLAVRQSGPGHFDNGLTRSCCPCPFLAHAMVLRTQGTQFAGTRRACDAWPTGKESRCETPIARLGPASRRMSAAPVPPKPKRC